ncbi:FG-GAP repeat domain-containing protein, partial [Spirochaetota bacterium]
GDLDLMTAEMGYAITDTGYNKRVWIAKNDGNGNFTAQVVTSSAKESHGMIVDDLDNDGDNEFVAIAYYFGTLQMLVNLNGDCQPPEEPTPTPTPVPVDNVKLTANSTCPSSGLAAFKVETGRATYYLEKQGAGLSSMIDSGGNDWISFKTSGGSSGDYRGFPNAVHNQADGSYFHPKNAGTSPSTCSVVSDDNNKVVIKAVSSSGNWECMYEFHPTFLTWSMTKVLSGSQYWVLYEGTPGGACNAGDFYMTSASGTQVPYTTDRTGDLPANEFQCFGDASLNRVLYLAGHNNDTFLDNYFQMDNAMVMFGLGRGAGITKYLTATSQKYSIGFIESKDYNTIKSGIQDVIDGNVATPTAPPTSPPSGSLIAPSSIAYKSSEYLSTAYGDRPAVNTINSSGIYDSPVTESSFHSTINVDMWLSGVDDTTPTIAFDLGSNEDLEKAVIWNYCESAIVQSLGQPIAWPYHWLSIPTNAQLALRPPGFR